MDDLVQLLMEDYELEEDAAQALATAGLGVVRNVLQTAGSTSDQMAALEPDVADMITEDDVLQSLVPYAAPFRQSRSRYKLPACGDGNCLFTSLRISIDLRVSCRSA